MAGSKESKHIVMFPFMAQGHFIPFLTLAKMLSSQGLTVTFLTTTASAPKLQSQVQLDSSIHIVPLSLPPIEGLTPGCESTDVLSNNEAQLLFISSHKLSQPFEEWLEQIMVQNSQKPACIITDVFLPWTAQSASKFGIPRVVFNTTGAMSASLLQFLFTNPVSEIISDLQIIEIRDRWVNVDLRRSELPQMLRSELFFSTYDLLPVLQQGYASGKQNCAATLVNTFDGLEAEYVKYLEESTGKPAWCIASPFLKPQQGMIDNESECIPWLDKQKENSVLYISFGSQAFLSEDQTKALAKGIAASNQAFIWTIKDPLGGQVNSCDYLPEGFMDETRDRGMVIHGWVPQLEILFHPSITCFMSHCGWNSTLESISAGVAMVAWPMVFDQFFNARLVIEKLGIGLQICEGYDAVPSSEVVEKTVKAAMTEEVGKEMRQRALQLKESINGDSSCKSSFKAFVSHILSLDCDGGK